MLWLVLAIVAHARTAPHPFRAESHHLCDICTKGIKILKSESEPIEKIRALCHSDEDMDCSGPCNMLVDELETGEIENLDGTPKEVCVRFNWCEVDAESKFYNQLSLTSVDVDYVNSVQGQWKAGKLRSNVTRWDFRKKLGAIVDPAIRCKVTYRPFKDSEWEAPEEFDSATNWPDCAKVIGDIRDQSNCGCCWAFAAAEAASDRLCINTKAQMMFPLSAKQMCFCDFLAGNGCNGGQIDAPWSYIKRTGLVTGGQINGTGPFGPGLCSEFDMPHCHHHGPQRDDPYPAEGQPGCPSQRSDSCPRKCDSTAKAPHDSFNDDKYHFDGSTASYEGEKEIQQGISTYGPVETAFTVYEDFANYVGGVYTHTSGSMEGGHAVKIVGWGVENGVKYWKVANSWNPYWGEKGYFRIARGRSECGIEDQTTGGEGTWGKK